MHPKSIKSVKHNAAKSVNRSIVKKSRHIGFGVFKVHSSMGRRQYRNMKEISLRLNISWPNERNARVITCICLKVTVKGIYYIDYQSFCPAV